MSLVDLYQKFSNFTAYRNEKLGEFDEYNDSAKLEIQRLELQKQQQQLEYDIKIAEVKKQMRSATERAQLNQQINDEKTELRQQLHQGIAELYHSGVKPAMIAQQLGLSSTTLIYQAIKTVDIGNDPQITNWDKTQWTYFDNAAIHRYAVSSDGLYVKVHSATGDDYRIVEAQYLKHVHGDSDIKVQRRRVDVALEMFYGTHTGRYHEAPNPYRQ